MMTRERAIEMAWNHVPVDLRPMCYGFNPPVSEWVIAFGLAAYRAGAEEASAAGADRRDAERWRFRKKVMADLTGAIIFLSTGVRIHLNHKLIARAETEEAAIAASKED